MLPAFRRPEWWGTLMTMKWYSYMLPAFIQTAWVVRDIDDHEVVQLYAASFHTDGLSGEGHWWPWSGIAIYCQLSYRRPEWWGTLMTMKWYSYMLPAFIQTAWVVRDIDDHEVVQLYAASFHTDGLSGEGQWWHYGVVQIYAASFHTGGLSGEGHWWPWSGTAIYCQLSHRRPEWWGTLMTMKWYSYILPAFIQTAWVVRDIDDHEVVQLYAASFHTDGLSGEGQWWHYGVVQIYAASFHTGGLSGEGHWWPWSGTAIYCQLSHRRPEWWGTLMTMKWYSYMLPACIQTAWVVRDSDDTMEWYRYMLPAFIQTASVVRDIDDHEVVQLYAASFHTDGLSGEGHWWPWSGIAIYCQLSYRRPEWWGTLMTMKWYSYMLPAFIQTAWVVRDIDDHEVVQLYAASFHTDGLSGEGQWWHYGVVQLYAASFHTDGLSGEGHWWPWSGTAICCQLSYRRPEWWGTVMTLWSGTDICCQLSYRRPEWWGTLMTMKWYSYILPAFRRPGDEEHCWAWSGTAICCQLSDGLAMRNIVGHEVVQLYAASFQTAWRWGTLLGMKWYRYMLRPFRRPEWWAKLMTMKWYSYVPPDFIQAAWVVRDIDDHEVVQLYTASFHTGGLSGEGHWWPWSGTAICCQLSHRRPEWWGTLMTMKWYSYILPAFIQTAWVVRDIDDHEVVQLYAASFHTDGLSGEGHWWPWSGTAICCQLSYRRPEWWGTVMTLWSGTAICCQLSYRRPEWWGTLTTMKWYSYVPPDFIQAAWVVRDIDDHEVVQLYTASFHTGGLSGEGHWRPWSGTAMYRQISYRRPEWWGTLMIMKWYSYILPAFIQTAWVVRDIDDHEVVQLYAASFHTGGLSGDGHWRPWSGTAIYCQLSYRRPEWWGTLMTMKWYSYILPAFIQTAWVVRDIDDHEVVQLYAASFHTDGLSGEGHWRPWSGTAIYCQLSYRRPEWWGTLMTMKWYSYILPAFIQTAWVVRDIDDYAVVQLYAASFHTGGLTGEGHWWPWSGTAICCQLSYRRPE